MRAALPRSGTSEKHYTHYLAEFLFTKQYTYNERILQFFKIIARLYSLINWYKCSYIFVILSHATSFSVDDYETSSTVLSLVGFQLVTNPDVQAKLRDEIISVLDKYDGIITYVIK